MHVIYEVSIGNSRVNIQVFMYMVKCRIVWHFIRVYTVCLGTKTFIDRNTSSFGNSDI